MQKTIDVKIRVVYPQISKNIPSKDKDQITATKTLKYEKRPVLATASSSLLSSSPTVEVSPIEEQVAQIKKEYQDLSSEINRFLEETDKELSGLFLQYDLEDEKNDMLAMSEEDLFGVASGTITYEMFLKVQEFYSIAKKELADRVEFSGELNAA